MTRRQYQLVALTMLIGSLLLVSAVSHMLSGLFPGTPVDQAPPPAQVDAAPSGPLADLPPPLPDPPSGTGMQAPMQPAPPDGSGATLSTEPMLDTSGMAVTGTDPMTGSEDPSGQPQGDAPSPDGTQPQPED